MPSVFVIDEEISIEDLVAELAEHGIVVLNYCVGDQASMVFAKVRLHFQDAETPITHFEPLLSVADEIWVAHVLTLQSPASTGALVEHALNAWVRADRPRQFWHAVR